MPSSPPSGSASSLTSVQRPPPPHNYQQQQQQQQRILEASSGSAAVDPGASRVVAQQQQQGTDDGGGGGGNNLALRPAAANAVATAGGAGASPPGGNGAATGDAKNNNNVGKKRRVRLSEAEPVIHGPSRNLPLTEEELNESWWSATDFAAVKDSVKRQCRDHRKNRRYSDCLTQAYRSACSMAARAEELEEEHYLAARAAATAADGSLMVVDGGSVVVDGGSAPSGGVAGGAGAGGVVVDGDDKKVGPSSVAADQPNPSAGEYGTLQAPPDEGLVRWLEDEGPRGLEGYSSRLHAMRRQRHLQETKHAVFLEQARQNISNERDDELLARQAAMASRRARTFATLLGQADAWAAKNDTGVEEDVVTATDPTYEQLREVSEELECPAAPPQVPQSHSQQHAAAENPSTQTAAATNKDDATSTIPRIAHENGGEKGGGERYC